MKLIVWMIREFLKMLNHYACGQSHVASQPAFLPPFRDPGGMLSRSLGMPSRNNGPPSIWDTHGISGNVFANPTASSSAPYPQESNPWVSNVSEHTSPHVMSESQTPAQDQRCQSGQSAKYSFDLGEGRFSNNYVPDQQRLQISELHFDKFPTPTTFACWKMKFKTEVCTCSQFPTEAMLWIKEVEMVESVDDLKSSCSVRGIRMSDFEVLDAKIASALNRITHNTRFKKKVSLEEMRPKRRTVSFVEGISLTWSTSSSKSIGANDSVENYTDLFTIVLRHGDIQEFDSKWDGILLSMTKIPHDDILEGLYKSRIRESDKLKTVLELYDLETHQKKVGPDYHRLKAMVKRSIEQEIRNKNLGARSGNFEKNAVVKNQGTKQRVQRILGDCWQWETNGQCVKGDNCSFRVQNRHSRIRLRILSCGRMSENHRGPEVPEVKVRVVECRDGLARITLEEFGPLHSVKNGILQNVCSTSLRMDAELGKSALVRIARLMNSQAKGLKRMMTKVQWPCGKGTRIPPEQGDLL